MQNNIGHTKLKTRRRQSNPLQEFDCLPPQLREWLRYAVLPWAPRSVRRIYNRSIARAGNVDFAYVCLPILNLEGLLLLLSKQLLCRRHRDSGLGESFFKRVSRVIVILHQFDPARAQPDIVRQAL